MDDEKIKRVKYVRALDKFAAFIVKSVKRSDFEWAKFSQGLEKIAENLEKIEPVYLNQPYAKALEDFINIALNSASKEQITRAANVLDKFKKAKAYNRQKSKNSPHDE